MAKASAQKKEPQVDPETDAPVEETAAKAPEPQPVVKPINLSRFKQAEHTRNLFTVTVEAGVRPQAVMQQEFWQHVGHLLRRGDRLEVMDDMMSFYMEIIVLASDRLWAHVAPVNMHGDGLYYTDLAKWQGRETPIPENLYKVDFAGLTKKWRVLYKGSLMKDEFETEGLARRWAAAHAAAQKL